MKSEWPAGVSGTRSGPLTPPNRCLMKKESEGGTIKKEGRYF